MTPVLFLGDNPALHTGLARIGRDLACRVASLPQYRVGFLGRGGMPNRKLPFMQYTFDERHQWGENWLEQVWHDFAGKEKGIIFTIWDPSRLLWFGYPTPALNGLHAFLTSGKFQRWGYFPVDATGPNDALTVTSAAAVSGYDRPLAYTEWGAGVISRSIGRPVDWIPHGLNLEKFQPRGKQAARIAMNVPEDGVVIGMNASNQARKDWGCAFAAIRELRKDHPNLTFWAHTDVPSRHWDFNSLVADYGLQDVVRVTLSGSLTDEELSYYYSACDLTILPSSEGFGYPIIESMACGVPSLHSSYGGGAELIPETMPIIHPAQWRTETPHNCVRPVFAPEDWVSTMETMLQLPPTAEECRAAVEHLDWKRLWPSAWKKWWEC